MHKPFLLRALGISVLKDTAYIVLQLWGVLFIFGYIPMKVYTLIFGIVFILITFLFGEWTFNQPMVSPRMVLITIVATYALDVLVNILVWSFLAGVNLFIYQNLASHLIFFSLHALAMAAAYYDRRRFNLGRRGPAEGLVR